MAAKEYTGQELADLIAIIGMDDPEWVGQVVVAISKWVERGDGVAVYENHDLGHHELGHHKIVSYGSPAAMLEMDTPPERLPDIGSSINWRYTLVGTYRGAPLPS
ncbi:MAG TPA: hypothetical protein VGI66_18055 [Streptosporangiaceae bacterium]|jgi:hypothetical protein